MAKLISNTKSVEAACDYLLKKQEGKSKMYLLEVKGCAEKYIDDQLNLREVMEQNKLEECSGECDCG